MSSNEWPKSVWKKNVSINLTEKFFSLEAYSGYSLQFADPEAQEILLEPDASDEELGKAVLKALSQSRFLPYERACELEKQVLPLYQDWIERMMKLYGYKGKRALFKDMKSCGVYSKDGLITIRPTKHEKLEGWGGTGIKKEDYVHLPEDSPPEEIGAALRLAFTRCK